MENGSEMSYEQVFYCICGLEVKNALINRATTLVLMVVCCDTNVVSRCA